MEIGPPSIGIPMVNGSLTGIGNGRLSCGVPIRFFHTTSLVFRSRAEIYPQAGCLHGRPNGDRNGFSVTPYGTPYCGCTPDSVPEPFASFGGSIGLPGPRGISFETKGSAIGLAIAT